MQEKKKREEERKLLLQSLKGLPTVTKSGKVVHLYANIGSEEDVDSVLENDSEGIGLLSCGQEWPCGNWRNPSGLPGPESYPSHTARSLLENDSEGIGLFRSEFLYLGRDDYPTEEEQYTVYKNVISKMNGKKVIIRTLDIGADKQADYFNIAECPPW